MVAATGLTTAVAAIRKTGWHPMKFHHQGRRVLIAGGDMGIGRDIALGFASEGARVALCGRDTDALHRVESEVRAQDVDTLSVAISENNTSSVQAAVQQVVGQWGGIDVLVNAMRTPLGGTIDTMDAEDLLDGTNRKQIAQYRFSQAVMPHMRAQKWGRIIDVHDAVTPKVDPDNLGAALNNVAGIALSKSLGMHLATDNILVNALNVGAVEPCGGAEGEAASAHLPEKWIEENIPIGRAATAEEIIAVALFLASDQASYISAASIDLSGGPIGPGSFSRRATQATNRPSPSLAGNAGASRAPLLQGPRAPSVAGKRVLVTGGTKGLGLAIARRYAKEGARIAICARDKSALASVASELAADAVDVLTGAVDVRDSGQVRRFMDVVAASWGGVDILVNNAGHTQFGTIDNLAPEEVLDHAGLMQANHLRFAQAVVPYMRRQAWGRIININSLCVSVVVPGGNGAVINRAACGALSQSLATSLARDNILVNSINIGFVETPQWADHRRMFAAAGEDGSEVMNGVARFIPLGRFGEADEVAGLAVFLGSDAASYVTGASIDLAGGLGQQLSYFSGYVRDLTEQHASRRARQ